jgi:hypothetical protein
MPLLQQLLAQTLILTMAIGGVACFCPADAAGGSAAGAGHEDHGYPVRAHEGSGPEEADATGCGHESCGPDCTRVSAVSAKAKATIAGKTAPSLDDLDVTPVIPGSLPSASAPFRHFLPPARQPLRPHDSPVRRFDRLLE